MAESPCRIAVQKAICSISLGLCVELSEICTNELHKRESDTVLHSALDGYDIVYFCSCRRIY